MASKWSPLAMMMLTVGQLLLMLMSSSSASQTVSSNCQGTCGDVAVPYPFGIGKGCYFNDYFSIGCNVTDDAASTPKPYLWDSNIEVLDISLNGELRIYTYISKDCYTVSGVQQQPPTSTYASLSAFPFSNTKNKFTAIGCDTVAVIAGSNGQGFSIGCLSVCAGIDAMTDGACDGIGCCQTTIPEMLLNYNASVGSLNNHTNVWTFNPCSYAFIVEEKSFNFSREDLNGMRNRTVVPSVLDWTVWNETCDEAAKNPASFACKAHSECFDFADVPGYRCNCSAGYEGNPYLGCVDIDECADPQNNPCEGICHNLDGSYACSCPKGSHGDGKKGEDAQGCIANPKSSHLAVILVGVGGIGGIALLLLSWWLYQYIKRRREIKLKQNFFKRNGGLLLQQRLFSIEDNHVEKGKLFASTELDTATDKFNENRILGNGGHGTVYKGMLIDGTIIAVKKSKVIDVGQVIQFINEVVILSEINHRHVVKLLGFCLESEVPLLVYEFVPNGTLYHYLHDPDREFPISWETRLRIANEVARALSYLHSDAAIPIYHRDIKSSNILLDEKYRAKVADFGASKSIPIDQTHLTTKVQGTFGYLDPEYYQTSQFTDKSDVYSFGVVLVELLTGEKPISQQRTEECRNLVSYFIISMDENRLFNVLDKEVLDHGEKKEIIAVSNLAKRCLGIHGRYRPTMKEVAMELERIWSLRNPTVVRQNEEEINRIRTVSNRPSSSIPMLMRLEPKVELTSMEEDQSLLSPR